MSVVCDRACRAQLLKFWSKVMLWYHGTYHYMVRTYHGTYTCAISSKLLAMLPWYVLEYHWYGRRLINNSASREHGLLTDNTMYYHIITYYQGNWSQ